MSAYRMNSQILNNNFMKWWIEEPGENLPPHEQGCGRRGRSDREKGPCWGWGSKARTREEQRQKPRLLWRAKGRAILLTRTSHRFSAFHILGARKGCYWEFTGMGGANVTMTGCLTTSVFALPNKQLVPQAMNWNVPYTLWPPLPNHSLVFSDFQDLRQTDAPPSTSTN